MTEHWISNGCSIRLIPWW